MKNLSSIFRGVALLAVLLSAGAAPALAQEAGSGPRAVVPQRVYEFGDIAKGEPIIHIFAISNEGTADLELRALPGSCGCQIVDVPKVVPAGQTRFVKVEINTSLVGAGRGFRTAAMETNDPLMPRIQVRLNFNLLANPDGSPRSDRPARAGRHIGPFFIEPTENWGASALIGEASSAEILITAERETVNFSGVESDTDGVTARIETVEPGKRYRLRIDAAAQDKPGIINANLRLLSDSKSLPVLPVKFTLRVRPPLRD